MTTTDVNPIRRIEVIATEADDVESEALAEAASTFPHLLVTGIEEIEHKGGSRYRVAVNTRPKKRSQQPGSTPPMPEPADKKPNPAKIGPRDGMTHDQWAAIDLRLLCPHCGGDGTVNRSMKSLVASKILGIKSSNVHLRKATEDPPLSVVRRVAEMLDVDLEEAVLWIAELHKAETSE